MILHCFSNQDLYTDFTQHLPWIFVHVCNGTKGKFKVVLPGFLWRTPQSPWQPGREVRAHRRTGTGRQVNNLSVHAEFNEYSTRIINALTFIWLARISFLHFVCFWKQIQRTLKFLVEPLVLLLWGSSDFCPGFQSQGGFPHLCVALPVHNRFLRFTSETTLASS